MKIERTKKGMWTIAILWIASNIVAYIILQPLVILSNLAWLIYLFWLIRQ